ncbi:YbjN domain-containing protein [Rhodococcus sp. NPDC058521]|uniref:YbjN domain-containing protein n=1 Tax=Rhodococcus sp. NPDC058521 TaxID=3346536 RepID=UPI0036462591
MTSEELQERASRALANFVAVDAAGDGSLGFEFAGALCSLSAMTLSDGLDVLSLTCVLAWDRPISAALHKKVAERNQSVQFGSVALFAHGRFGDVILRYTFPAAGLSEEALTTMLLLVLSGADTARQGLLP